ncbi:heme ABC exporter ATP-binding protein CcmA [Commensalibacter oyaizuii]|uniref:Heme ABC exporter ATP-binding protein CcmA n=1 Tax=Commensalibacter oyaizuii TaxID=3043873 RepID=A0ABT6Q1W7_9PROT|nr:heme ABC exporter ATP-binding protein CcmA [Commensalibacter sp. TBRC 16381]MDI2091100.1 heme ABC exporter ATP-binding protein CcmA [Commensalibacter sp. TBRC 16381]
MQLSAFRGEKLVLKNVNFTLNSGESLIIQGPNGAGKSTLLRILAGFKKIDSGEILWNHENIFDNLIQHTQNVAWLSHQDSLKPALTVRENLSLVSHIYKTDLRDALQTVNLSSIIDLPARMLSAGQKRRVAIARILLKPARLWLLDEPSVGLDQQTMEILAEIFNQFKSENGMIITTTHVPLPLPNSQYLQLTPSSIVKAPF